MKTNIIKAFERTKFREKSLVDKSKINIKDSRKYMRGEQHVYAILIIYNITHLYIL